LCIIEYRNIAHNIDDDTLYVGVLRLPVGRYLTRMEVDDEWVVDDERPLDSVGGDDFNTLNVEGQAAWTAQRAADVVRSFGTVVAYSTLNQICIARASIPPKV
jgi:hypothetical protein